MGTVHRDGIRWRCLFRGDRAIADQRDIPLPQHRSHSRHWRDNLYVYPVISRRSRGLSIGVNLNPDKACNFNCAYCQVDRTVAPAVRRVDLPVLREELTILVREAQSGALFADPAFAQVPGSLRRIEDIAFSGDGEPTASKHFPAAVELAAEIKRDAGLTQTRIVLITNACFLQEPRVVTALEILDHNQGQIWAKLDAGTEAYYRQINRAKHSSLQQVVENITATARVRPLVIQSLFLMLHGAAPTEDEIAAYCDRLNEIQRAGGRISHVQVYTVARVPAESYVEALADAEVDVLAQRIHAATSVPTEAYHGLRSQVEKGRHGRDTTNRC